MTKKFPIAAATLGGALSLASAAYAAPVFVGLQETGVNGGAITQEATGNGSANLTNFFYGNAINGGFLVSVSVSGTPPLPEPDLLSNAVSATATHPGTISIYISETNQFPTNFQLFRSLLEVSALGAGASVVESTYIHECAVPLNTPCAASDKFATTTLLSTETFTSVGTIVDFTANGLPIATTPYEITEVYTINLTQQNTSSTENIGVRAVPEPATLVLFGLGLLGFGAIRRHRAA